MEVKIGQYKGIEVEVETYQVTDEDVERELVTAMQKNPIKESQDRPLAEGDTALFDFKGLKDGVAFDGGTAENYELVIGSGQFIPGFESQMVGMVKGEERSLDVTFPENYGMAELAGQPVVFEVKLHDIYALKEPQLNDEFAKSLHMPGIETVEQLTTFVEDFLKDDAKKRANADAQNKILDALIDTVEAEITEEAVNDAIDMQVQNFQMQLAQQGMQLEQYLQMIGANLQSLRDQIKPTAKRQVKLDKALAKIVELEGIVADEDEVNKQFEEIAKAYNMPLETVKQTIKFEELAKEYTIMKATQIVFDNAKVNFK